VRGEQYRKFHLVTSTPPIEDHSPEVMLPLSGSDVALCWDGTESHAEDRSRWLVRVTVVLLSFCCCGGIPKKSQ
jgi:hypothetical protein